MSVPPLFEFSTNSFLSIGLPVAKNTFYQLSEKELKKQIALSANNKKESENSLPPLFIIEEKNDKQIFNYPESFDLIEEKDFDILYQKMTKHLENKQIWIRDSNLILRNNNMYKTRHISEDPKDDLFILKNFTAPDNEELKNFEPDWYFINTPDFLANLKEDELNHTQFAIINFIKKVVLIGGTSYSEIFMKRLLDKDLAVYFGGK